MSSEQTPDPDRVKRGAEVLRILLGDLLGSEEELHQMAWAVLRAADDPDWDRR